MKTTLITAYASSDEAEAAQTENYLKSDGPEVAGLYAIKSDRALYMITDSEHNIPVTTKRQYQNPESSRSLADQAGVPTGTTASYSDVLDIDSRIEALASYGFTGAIINYTIKGYYTCGPIPGAVKSPNITLLIGIEKSAGPSLVPDNVLNLSEREEGEILFNVQTMVSITSLLAFSDANKFGLTNNIGSTVDFSGVTVNLKWIQGINI